MNRICLPALISCTNLDSTLTLHANKRLRDHLSLFQWDPAKLG